MENIKAFAKRDDVVATMTKSLAPSICGHTHEKTALLLMLLGGKLSIDVVVGGFASDVCDVLCDSPICCYAPNELAHDLDGRARKES